MTEPDFLREEPPAHGGGGRPSPVLEYLRNLERALRRGDATEHTHRPALKELLEALDDKIVATNEPKRSECGAPDYVVSRKRDQLTLGYIEAKDVGADLNEIERGDQLRRYLAASPGENLLLTDYLEFRWFVGGKKRETFHLARLQTGGRLAPVAPEQLERAGHLLVAFLSQRPVDIASAEALAGRLAKQTHPIRDLIVGAFATGAASQPLRDWRGAFAATLLPELAPQADAGKEAEAVAEFADMFAQTLAYGLFSARASAGSTRFNREKAQKLIPRANPFLRAFFEQITGAALDDEPFAGFVGDLIQTLDHADMGRILEDFGKRGRRRDPVVHFYETFLQAYDPKLRELRGVYYTPEPVVNYIVHSVDRLLREKFGIKAGLADHSKIKIGSAGVPPAVSGVAPETSSAQTAQRDAGQGARAACAPEEVHRVLILDPAAGTATFLYTVLDFIRAQFKKKKNAGQWGGYVHEHLLPRLFGFELLMAPYAVAHFKLGLALAAMDEEPLFRQQWSYEPQAGERVNVFLTNTLEDLERATEQLGPLRALSDEANSAYEIKKHKPVLVVLGNPPYSGHSANKGEWISRLVRDYYFCDGQPLGEKNPKWLQDDYVKFIRWAQWRIAKTGSGVLAFITNHGYLDNPTFRGMRQNLMQNFDEIYLLDLHGNAKKKETVPNSGEPDKNVFDIQQGVAIGLFVKLPPELRAAARPSRALRSTFSSNATLAASGEDAGSSGRAARAPLATVHHCDLWGAHRQRKYDWLDGHHVDNTNWKKLEPTAPYYLFIPQDTKRLKEYERGWKITEMMPINGWGIATRKDYLLVDFDQRTLVKKFRTILSLPTDEAIRRFEIRKAPHWDFAQAREQIHGDPATSIYPILFRPFDARYVYYEKAMIERGDHRFDLMRHMFDNNVALITVRRIEGGGRFTHFFATNKLSVLHSTSAKEGNFVFPLYLYPNGKLPEEDLFAHADGRRPNLSAAFIKEFCEKLQVKFVPDGLGRPGKREIGPELIFHYAYAVFHSPAYRGRYAEYLRANFPRLPLTSDFELFRALAGFGGELVDLHARGQGAPRGLSFPVKGDNVIEEVRYQPPTTDTVEDDAVGDDVRSLGSKKEKPESRYLVSYQGTKVGRVWINDRQYVEGVPEAAWSFPIGGYLPAQRWLKDRIGRALGYDEREEYQRIIWALLETKRLMSEIDATIEQHGGWPLK